MELAGGFANAADRVENITPLISCSSRHFVSNLVGPRAEWSCHRGRRVRVAIGVDCRGVVVLVALSLNVPS